MSLVRIDYYNEASPRFVEDSCLKDDNAVIIRSPDLHGNEVGGVLQLTVIDKSLETKSYGKTKKLINVYKFKLMDGTFAAINAQLNTGLSSTMKHNNMPLGSTIIVKKYTAIWGEIPEDQRSLSDGILLIHDFSWKPGPGNVDPLPSCCASIISIDYSTVYIDPEVFEYMDESNHTAFLVAYKNEEDDSSVLKLMTANEIKQGLFIPCIKDRMDFIGMRAKRDFLETVDEVYSSSSDEEDEDGFRVPKPCRCRRQYGLAECVTVQYPLTEAHEDRNAIFDTAMNRLEEEDILAEDFDSLHPAKQRWCMYWWYSVNLFQFKGGDAKKLPPCFVDACRLKYPNPKGEFFTGFRCTADRRNKKQKMVLNESTNEK